MGRTGAKHGCSHPFACCSVSAKSRKALNAGGGGPEGPLIGVSLPLPEPLEILCSHGGGPHAARTAEAPVFQQVPQRENESLLGTQGSEGT